MSAYVLITAVRDERPLLPALLGSVLQQTRRPAAWVLVDDGSRDGSRSWLQQRAAEHPWIRVASPRRVSRVYLENLGVVLAEGIDAALAASDGTAIEFVATLDADVSLPAGHYEGIARAFAADASLGIAGSLLRGPDGVLLPWQRADFPWGSTQALRMSCLASIGGLPRCAAPDAVANVKARALGWRVALVDGVEAQLRREPSVRGGVFAGYRRMGQRTWYLGLHPLAVLLRVLGYSMRPPSLRGVAFAAGWLGDAIGRASRCADPHVRRYYGHVRPRELLDAVLQRGSRYVAE